MEIINFTTKFNSYVIASDVINKQLNVVCNVFIISVANLSDYVPVCSELVNLFCVVYP